MTGHKVNVFSILTLRKCHEKKAFLFTQWAVKPSPCVASKPVQVMSVGRELWSHGDSCKCTHSINNAVLSCVNYSIQGFANAHSAEQVRLCYSKTQRDIERSHRRAWPTLRNQHVLGCSLVKVSSVWLKLVLSEENKPSDDMIMCENVQLVHENTQE